MFGCGMKVSGLLLLTTVFAAQHVNTVNAQAVAEAETLEKTALAFAPQDVSFFATNLNLGKAWEGFLGGNFVTRLRDLPYVQRFEGEVLAQWENPEGQMETLKGNLKNPNVKNLLDLIVDMDSQEIFYYGASDWNDAIGGIMGLYEDINARSDDPIAMQEFLAELDDEYLDGVKIPTTVIGFRLKNEEIARTLLDALQGAMQLGLRQVPELAPLAKQIAREDLKDGQALSITLTTALIPMDNLDPNVKEMLGGLIEGLEGRKLVLSFGIRAKMLLMSISEDVSPLLTFGTGESLVNHKRLKVLVDNMPRDLRSISYSSKAWRESQWDATYGSYFQNLADQFAAAVSSEESDAVDVEKWQQEIIDDAAELDARIGDLEVEFDAAVSWSFASEVGLEGMTYDWSENVLLANAKPMSILKHAGTKPLLMVAVKEQPQPLIGELLTELIERAPEHIRRFITLAETDEEELEQALKVLEGAWPLVEESFSIAMRDILPALDEHEGLFTFSAQWTTQELSVDLPPPNKPLPLPEFAAAIKLRNRDQFLSGCRDLYGVFDKVIELVREFQPDSLPEGYNVPRPQQEELAGSTRFFYPEFSQWAFEGFEPQVIVSNDTVVVGYSARQALDLIQEKPLATRPAWLSPEMPVAGVSLVDMAGMVNAVSPWLEYGFQLVLGDLDTPVSMNDGPIPTGAEIVQIWECLSSLGKVAATTVIDDDGVTVSRWVWVGQ
jgi:hypothetical protein